MDVWFDSGSTHAAVLDSRDYLTSPADVYLEGGDQYRGWFQSSMLTAIAAKGQAPYKQIITHGWTVDGEGKAMHKSLGNAVSPQEVIKDYGADMLRLWVSSADYTQDMRISPEIMKQLSQAYLKIRNTARYILGNLDGFRPDSDQVPYPQMEELDKWALSRFNELVGEVRAAYERYEFHAVYRALYRFCVVDLSSFYLDVVKDRLYCEGRTSSLRRSVQTAMYQILDGLTRMMAPILAFTSDEIWGEMPHHSAANGESVLLNDIPAHDPALVLDEAAAARWTALVTLREEVNKALETARGEKTIGKSLEAAVTLSFNGTAKELEDAVAEFDAGALADLCIVSGITRSAGEVDGFRSEAVPGLTVKVTPAGGKKCARCWKIDPHVGEDELCPRCHGVVENWTPAEN
jgi:isoleucyl-tRNA synthetase